MPCTCQYYFRVQIYKKKPPLKQKTSPEHGKCPEEVINAICIGKLFTFSGLISHLINSGQNFTEAFC